MASVLQNEDAPLESIKLEVKSASAFFKMCFTFLKIKPVYEGRIRGIKTGKPDAKDCTE
jgi:hypothetical protein